MRIFIVSIILFLLIFCAGPLSAENTSQKRKIGYPTQYEFQRTDACYRKQEFDSCLIYLQNAMAGVESDNAEKKGYIAAYKGNVFLSKSMFDSAMYYFYISNEQYKKIDDYLFLCYNFGNMFNIHNVLEQFDEAEFCMNKMQYYYSKLGKQDEHRKIVINGQFADLYYLQGKYDKGYIFIEKSIEYAKEFDHKRFLAEGLLVKGKILIELDRYIEALQTLADTALDSVNNSQEAIKQLLCGICYKELDKDSLAINALYKVLELEKGNSLLENTLECYDNLAAIYANRSQYDSAITYINLYRKLFDKSNQKHNPEIRQRCFSKIKTKEILQDYHDSLKTKQAEENRYFWLRILLGLMSVLLLAALYFLVRYIINNKKLAVRRAELNTANQELTENNYNKDKLLSIVGHDLRTPITVVMGAAETLQYHYDSLSPEKVAKYSARILSSTIHIDTMLENLLDWSRMLLNKQQIALESSDLKQLIDDNINYIRDMASDKHIEIIDNTPDKLIWNVDQHLFDSLMRNLLTNAVKYTMSGAIEIDARVEEKLITFSIKDTGIGIPAYDLEKIFQKSFTTYGTNNEKGTGLGLLLCRKFVGAHGGEIWAESQINIGSVFYFKLSN